MDTTDTTPTTPTPGQLLDQFTAAAEWLGFIGLDVACSTRPSLVALHLRNAGMVDLPHADAQRVIHQLGWVIEQTATLGDGTGQYSVTDTVVDGLLVQVFAGPVVPLAEQYAAMKANAEAKA